MDTIVINIHIFILKYEMDKYKLNTSSLLSKKKDKETIMKFNFLVYSNL